MEIINVLTDQTKTIVKIIPVLMIDGNAKMDSVSKVVIDAMAVTPTVMMDQMKKTVLKNVLSICSSVKMDKNVSQEVGGVMVISTVTMDQTKQIVNIFRCPLFEIKLSCM